MATHSSQLAAITHATESSFAEDVDTVATRTPALGTVDLSGLSQPKIDPGIMKQRAHEGFHDIRGAFGGSFTVEYMLTGAGASTAGALPAQTEFSKLLGYVLGNSGATGAGTTLTGATDADTWATTTTDDLAAGEVVRLGALGDGDGEGQAYAISTVTGTAVEVLTGATATPAASAVVYGGYMHYPSESPTSISTVQSIRMQLHTANEQVLCHGVFPQSISISGLNPGEQPRVSVTYGVSWWEYKNVTFPVSAAHETASGMTVAAGSLFVNTVGTTTSNLLGCREFNLNIDLEVVPQMGTGGVNAHQTIVNARRVRCQASIDFVTDAEDAGTRTANDEWNTDENSAVYKHLMYTLNTRDGASAAIYLPKLKMIGDRPQQIDHNGLNAIRYSYQALTGPTTTSELTLSNFRIYIG